MSLRQRGPSWQSHYFGGSARLRYTINFGFSVNIAGILRRFELPNIVHRLGLPQADEIAVLLQQAKRDRAAASSARELLRLETLWRVLVHSFSVHSAIVVQ